MLPRCFRSPAFRDIYLAMILALLVRYCFGGLVQRGIHVQESSVGKYESGEFGLAVESSYTARQKMILSTPLDGRVIVLGNPTSLQMQTYTGQDHEIRLEAVITQQSNVVHWKDVEQFFQEYNGQNPGWEITKSMFIMTRNQGAKFYRFAVPLDENPPHSNRFSSGIRVNGVFRGHGLVIAVISARRTLWVEEGDGSA